MRLLFMAALFCFSKAAFAADAVFFVDMIKGEVKLKSKGKAAELVKPKMLIQATDMIILGNDKCEVTLVDRDTRYIVLNKKGTHAVSTLIKLQRRQPQGLTEKYFSLVWKELANPTNSVRAGINELVGSWGGVDRGMCRLARKPVNNWKTSDDSIRFSWAHNSATLQYTFSLFNERDELLIQLTVRDTQLIIHRDGLMNLEMQVFHWKVDGLDPACIVDAVGSFTWFTKSAYEAEINKIKDAVSDNGTPWYYLDLANRLFANDFFDLSAFYLRKLTSE